MEQTVLQLHIDGLTSELQGVAHLHSQALFVSGALPGEDVEARLIARKKRYAIARLERIVHPAPQRSAPPCPYYEQCGGCAIQHAAYAAQLEYKRQVLAQTLQRIGGLELAPRPLLGMEQPWRYRNRVMLHRGTDGRLGFYAKGSHDICVIDSCPLLLPSLNEMLAELTPLCAGMKTLRHLQLRCDHQGGQMQAVLISEQPERLPCLNGVSVWNNYGADSYGLYKRHWRDGGGATPIIEDVSGLRLKLSPAAFLQVNYQQMLVMYRQIAELAALDSGDTLLDLYAGAGSIGLYLARRVSRLIGVESYAPAATDAAENARLNAIGNAEFIAEAAERFLPRYVQQGGAADVLILDPPRAGCAPELLRAAAASGARAIVYASCDAATLARDLRLLAALGYQPQAVQPLDMFPQTAHMETVCLLSRE
ncbi:MAG: 23S rRNA (uracil(1939)-C(5))-methyltransferase RlmD [Bacillota bacterium]|nr:23S rRNA (uracil(1939)-C(5))-methyltransferase RlmD [Bacillota bacterium]